MKPWIEGNQIILITADKILFGEHSQEEIKIFTDQLGNGIIPNGLNGIPLRYIKGIQLDDRKRRIDIELGRGSVEKINFKSNQLRNEVFDYIQYSLKGFGLVRISSLRIWKSYGISLLFIVLIISLLLTVRQFSGSSPGSTAIAILMTWISETLDKTTILLIGLSLISWRTITLILDLKALRKMLRLSRKNNNSDI